MKAASTSPWTTSTGCRAACRCSARSRRPSADVHMEDVHRAGGIMAILGELDRAGLINRDLPTVHSADLGDALDHWDISRTKARTCASSSGRARRRADPGLQPGPALGRARPRPRGGRHPLRRTCLLAGRQTPREPLVPGSSRLVPDDHETPRPLVPSPAEGRGRGSGRQGGSPSSRTSGGAG